MCMRRERPKSFRLSDSERSAFQSCALQIVSPDTIIYSCDISKYGVCGESRVMNMSRSLKKAPSFTRVALHQASRVYGHSGGDKVIRRNHEGSAENRTGQARLDDLKDDVMTAPGCPKVLPYSCCFVAIRLTHARASDGTSTATILWLFRTVPVSIVCDLLSITSTHSV